MFNPVPPVERLACGALLVRDLEIFVYALNFKMQSLCPFPKKQGGDSGPDQPLPKGERNNKNHMCVLSLLMITYACAFTADKLM